MRTSKRFFSLEGIDGSGKTTQLEMLAHALESRGYSCVRFREPGGSKISESIRSILLNTDFKGVMADSAELLLYNAARAQVIAEIIKPALADGKVVLADRFAWSTLAYQGFGRGLNAEMVTRLSEITCGEIFPDLTLVLDIHPSQAKLRRQAEGKIPDRLESEADAFFERVQNGYRTIAQTYSDCVTLLDATLDREALHHQILDAVLKKLEK